MNLNMDMSTGSTLRPEGSLSMMSKVLNDVLDLYVFFYLISLSPSLLLSSFALPSTCVHFLLQPSFDSGWSVHFVSSSFDRY